MARSKKTKVDGILFDSKAEAERYKELKFLEKAEEIEDLTLQPKFDLLPRFQVRKRTIRPMIYTADFMYNMPDGERRVEEVKGHVTEPYRMRKKLFLFTFARNFVFVETKKKYGKHKFGSQFTESIY